MTHRARLTTAAVRIAATRGDTPTPPAVAFRKLFFQERRDRARPGAPRVGWKRGELVEVIIAPATERGEEWGDVGYYVAQTWGWLWAIYAAATPAHIIEAACAKFERRAEKEEKK